ncbi:hypothetical protein [Aquirufa sp.]|jgi:hypothetical protein|uniref:hypothetical protein n=1 Tax=Aquirufa sp. TaxID=2676249 RepID=UPI0037BEAA3C
MSKFYFCSFADSRLHRSLSRIEYQARHFNVYHSIHVCNESVLNDEFKKKYAQYLKPGIRGFGFWCWKPQIILQILQDMEEGDVLQYTDSGCHLNPRGKKRLLEYFEIVSKSKSGILAFRSKSEEEIDSGDLNPKILEYQYNKGDLLEYFKCLNDKSITHTPQFQGGIIFIRKEKSTVEFVKKWISVFEQNFNLLNDSPSIIPNISGFIEHRHDQSIYSLLCKEKHVDYLFTNEYFTVNKWENLDEKPIWVKWDKDFGVIDRVKNFIRRKVLRITK